MLPRNLVLLVVLALLAGACADARTKALRTSLVGLNAAREGFVEADRVAQDAIVDLATSHEDGAAKLAAYRRAREPVVSAFAVAYRTLAAAALLDASFDEAVKAVRTAIDLAKGLKP